MIANSNVLIIGEVIFDHFPNGGAVLGGAPFNVAWNLQGLGRRPHLIAAVGADEFGDTAIERMKTWGMRTDGIQVSASFPTGQARVEVIAGEPHFSILDEQAYDDICPPERSLAYSDYCLLYVGSLAFRRDPSRATIREIMSRREIPKFVDINIRQPWFSVDAATELLSDATWTKLNVSELSLLTKVPCDSREQITDAVEVMRGTHNGKHYFITCGSEGAVGFDENGVATWVESPAPDPFIDAVGAGDAFASGAIDAIVRGGRMREVVQAAVGLAAKTCSIQGATTMDHSHYQTVSPS